MAILVMSCVSFVGYQILTIRRSLVSALNAWTVVYMFVVHEEYLVITVDLTSHVGTIPTCLASYFLV